MTRPFRSQLLLGILAFALSACATIPGQPPTEEMLAATPEGALQLAARKSKAEAKRFEQDGRLRESLERWKIVLTIEPSNAEARKKEKELEAKVQVEAQRHITAGKELLQRQKKEAAQHELLAALRLDPSNREVLDQLYKSDEQLGEQTAFARPLRKGGTPMKIEAGADAKAKSAPEEESEEEEETGEEVSFADAAELFRQGDYLGAIDGFTRVLAKQPGLREALEYQKLAYYNQGIAYLKGESYANALKMFEQLKKMQPDFKRLPQQLQTAREKLADQHYLAGIRHFREKKLQEAIEEWDQALTFNPKLESARRDKERARKLLKSLQEIK